MRSFNASEPINALGSTPEMPLPLPLPFSLEGVEAETTAAATTAGFIILTRIFFAGFSFSLLDSFSFSFSLPDSSYASTTSTPCSNCSSETIS